MYQFEEFDLNDLQSIVNGHFGGKSSFAKLNPNLQGYACDSKFCNAALVYLIKKDTVEYAEKQFWAPNENNN